jgi:AraC-like DNA-binding protein
MSKIRVNYFTNFINRRRDRYPAAQVGILWVKSGNLSYRFSDGKAGSISAGQYCYYNSSEFINLETHIDDQAFDAIAIILDTSILQEFLQSHQTSNSPLGTHYPIADCNDYVTSILTILLNNLEKNNTSQHSLTYLAMAILSELTHSHPQTIERIKHSLTLSISQKVIHYIESNIEDSISLEQTATHLSMSTATLKRKLSTEGLSFSSLLKIKRINYAANLLRNTSHSITQIAFASGFKSAAHFSTAFKSIQGLSPKEFRAKLRIKRSPN